MCYDIDEFFLLVKNPNAFEEKLSKDCEVIYDNEVRMREKKIEEIERALNDFKMRTFREIESVRESEDEIRTQMNRLLKILKECRRVSSRTKSRDEEEKLSKVEERTKTTLDSLTVELASKRDEINAILSNYRKRIARVFE